MILRVYLEDYDIELEISFTVTIEACVVYDIHVT